MNTKSMQGSNVHKVENEGKMFIVVVKPLILLTLPYPFTSALMQKRITLEETLFWVSDKLKMLVITVNGRWWPPYRGWWLFTTQYFRWDQISFGLLQMRSNIDDLIWVTSLLIILIWRHLLSSLLPFQLKTASLVAYMNYTNFHFFKYISYLFTKYVICSSYLLLFICL